MALGLYRKNGEVRTVMFRAFLIKYAEIGVKGKNRYLFENALVQQIKYALKRCEGEFAVRKTDGRIYVDAVSDFDYDETVQHLQKVFGISGICPMVYVEDEGFEKLRARSWTIWTGSIRLKTGVLRWRPDAPERIIRLIPWRSIWSWAARSWMLFRK